MNDERHKEFIDDPRILLAPPFKPLIVDPTVLRPLPQSMWDMACGWCDKRQARWEVFLPDMPKDGRKGLPLCSLCWLYESEWGSKRRPDLTMFVMSVEEEISRKFEKRPTGELIHGRDGDRILGAIAVTSRIFAYHETMKRRRGGGDGT